MGGGMTDDPALRSREQRLLDIEIERRRRIDQQIPPLIDWMLRSDHSLQSAIAAGKADIWLALLVRFAIGIERGLLRWDTEGKTLVKMISGEIVPVTLN
jgi:hypothetical protein